MFKLKSLANNLYKQVGKQTLVILFTVFTLSLLFTYNYTKFGSSASVATGQAYTAKSIALQHDVNVDEYWGNAGADVFYYGGHWHTPYALFNPIIMGISYFVSQIPIYLYVHLLGPINGRISLIYESIALSLLHSIGLVIIGFLLATMLRTLKVKEYLKKILILGTLTGTILFPYSISFFNHIIASALLLGAFWYLFNTKESYKKYLLVGTLTSFSFLTEYPTILFSLSVFIYTVFKYSHKHKKFNVKKYFKANIAKLLLTALPIIIGISFQLIFNKLNFGNYFLFGEMIYNKISLSHGKIPATFSQNPIFGLYGMYFSPLKGLFVYSPFLLISILGVKELYKRDKVKFYTIVSYILIVSVLYATWSDCFGATTIGTRYMVTIIPFISILAGYGLLKIQGSKVLTMLFILTVTYSIITILLVSLVGIASHKMGNCKNINKFGPGIKLQSAIKTISNKNFTNLAPVILNAK